MLGRKAPHRGSASGRSHNAVCKGLPSRRVANMFCAHQAAVLPSATEPLLWDFGRWRRSCFRSLFTGALSAYQGGLCLFWEGNLPHTRQPSCRERARGSSPGVGRGASALLCNNLQRCEGDLCEIIHELFCTPIGGRVISVGTYGLLCVHCCRTCTSL